MNVGAVVKAVAGSSSGVARRAKNRNTMASMLQVERIGLVDVGN
jgi:hypothetical protein